MHSFLGKVREWKKLIFEKDNPKWGSPIRNCVAWKKVQRIKYPVNVYFWCLTKAKREGDSDLCSRVADPDPQHWFLVLSPIYLMSASTKFCVCSNLFKIWFDLFSVYSDLFGVYFDLFSICSNLSSIHSDLFIINSDIFVVYSDVFIVYSNLSNLFSVITDLFSVYLVRFSVFY